MGRPLHIKVCSGWKPAPVPRHIWRCGDDSGIRLPAGSGRAQARVVVAFCFEIKSYRV